MMSANNGLRNVVQRHGGWCRAAILGVAGCLLAACTAPPAIHPQPPRPIASTTAPAPKPASPLPRAALDARAMPVPHPQPDWNKLSGLNPEQPQQIALMLPFSGRLAGFGNAIRDGFMAAWYDAQTHGGTPPRIRLYDTSAANIAELYQRALADGAQAVIGPLEKSHVAALYPLALSVPTLALNRADLGTPPPAQLFQFGLAPEDEASEVARLGALQHFHHALIIAPETEQHSRELQAFTQAWQQGGGDIAATALFRNPQSMSLAIKTALNIAQSEARKRDIESLLGRKVEFTPHRRGDIDMVFVLAHPQQMRSIMPTLAFHYAGDIPVYALSRSYGGVDNPALDHDIEGLRFTELPWMLDPQQPLKQQILANRPQSKSYLRLYALGVDSFALYPRLHPLKNQPESGLNGQTGYLTVTPQRVIRRELPLAQIKEGVARAAAPITTDTERANEGIPADTRP